MSLLWRNMNWLNILSPSKLPCDHAALERLEKRISRRLPSEYREFLISLNGGTVFVDHELKTQLYGETYELAVACIFPLTDWGVVDTQERWLLNGCGSVCALPIADDGGTGFYFLLVDDEHRGQIYFAYKDEFFSTPPSDWPPVADKLPSCLGFVAKNFAKFGELMGQK